MQVKGQWCTNATGRKPALQEISSNISINHRLKQMYRNYTKRSGVLKKHAHKFLFIMRLTIIILIATLPQASAATFGQKITYVNSKVTLVQLFKVVKIQTGYNIVWYEGSLDVAKTINANFKNTPLEEVMDQVLKDQPLSYTVDQQTIIIKEKEPARPEGPKHHAASIDVHGKVVDDKGDPMPGVTISVRGTDRMVVADTTGSFTLTNVDEKGELRIFSIGYKPLTLKVAKDMGRIRMEANISALDQIQIIGYGTTTQRLNTGDVTAVKAADIEKQPVSNPLAALEGRVPGLIVSQSSGVNGSGFKVQLRGQSSLLQGSDPLFIIDGVPYSPGNNPLNQLVSAAGSGSSATDGLSPFDLINPSDIESIDVLKDADATSIYGSRGANGVVLITTKKGKAGKTQVNASVYSGISRITQTMPMLNTQQYVAMRNEAFSNDGIVPDASTAPDLFLWDTTRYTDFKKLLIGNTARTSDAELSVSGGDNNTQFLIGGGYHYASSVYPTSNADNRGSLHVNINHNSENKKFTIALNTIYSSDINNLPTTDLTAYINTAPNLKLYDGNGNLNWQEGGASYSSLGMLNANPLAFQFQTYKSSFQNLSSNLVLNYKLLTELDLKVSLGYNVINGQETSLYPSTSLDPFSGQLPFSNFSNSMQKNWIIEPQAEYKRQMGKGKLSLLIGSTWQDNSSNSTTIGAYDYSSDLLLNSITAASYTEASNSSDQYRYTGVYGRINYNYDEKYLINISGRRDGSSRFGPDNRFSNFAAIGGAWIFSNEAFIKDHLNFISFGKVRASYGITGNDQIGNYKYLDTWSPGEGTYQGVSVLNPVSLFNPSFSWEKNRKTEVAIDLGLFNDRLLISGDYYYNISGNQLVNYTLPTQTGFSSVLENLNATIQNKGWEFSISSKNITNKGFYWTSALTLTIPQNKLLSFPGLSTSSYRNTFVIGQSLSTRRLYHYLGVSPATGIYQFLDADHNGSLDAADLVSLKNTDPKLYGGLSNTVGYKNFDLTVFLEFKKQNGYNYLNTLGGNVPGYFYQNQPVVVLNRWRAPGDQATVEKFTSTSGDAFDAAALYLSGSDAIISEASYIRVKNIALSYQLPAKFLSRYHIAASKLFFRGENLFTITGYKGADPENQNLYILPPLKTFTLGLQLTL